MKILLTAATCKEVESLLQQFEPINDHQFRFSNHQIHLLITGPGMLATAFELGQHLAKNQYDLAINIGICGAFDRNLDLGQTVVISDDRIAEEGAEDHDQWLSMEEINLREKNEFPFQSSCLKVDLNPFLSAIEGLERVRAITVNRVHGYEKSIEKVKRYFQPQVESMEGAAFLYACQKSRLKALQLRAVSNYVENRKREAWKIEDALRNLAQSTLKILSHVKG